MLIAELEIYNIVLIPLKCCFELDVPRMEFGLFASGHHVYIIGGTNKQEKRSVDVMKMDIGDGKITHLPKLPIGISSVHCIESNP